MEEIASWAENDFNINVMSCHGCSSRAGYPGLDQKHQFLLYVFVGSNDGSAIVLDSQ